jgi:DNA-binding MarR family transcriptional regulator
MREPTDIASDIRRWMEAFTVRSMHEWMRWVRSTGMSMAQMGLLMFLYHGSGCAVHAIGAHMGISRPAASMLADRLVRAGLAERTEQPGDRRGRRVALSAGGREFVDRAMRERDRWIDDLAARLSPAEEAAVRRVLPVLMEAERRLGAAPQAARSRTNVRRPPRRTPDPGAATKRARSRR